MFQSVIVINTSKYLWCHELGQKNFLSRRSDVLQTNAPLPLFSLQLLFQLSNLGTELIVKAKDKGRIHIFVLKSLQFNHLCIDSLLNHLLEWTFGRLDIE